MSAIAAVSTSYTQISQTNLSASTGKAGEAPMPAEQASGSMVSTQVDMMLAEIDPALADNNVLKMLIAVMVMDALLGGKQQQEGGQSAMDMLAALASESRGGSSVMMLSMHSETTSLEYGGEATTGGTQAYGQLSQSSSTGGSVDLSM